MNWKTVAQSVNFKTWKTRIRLDCLKSSGELETSPPSEKRLTPTPEQQHLASEEMRMPPVGNKISEINQATNGHPKSFWKRHLRMERGIS